jgi:hypothetical protein
LLAVGTETCTGAGILVSSGANHACLQSAGSWCPDSIESLTITRSISIELGTVPENATAEQRARLQSSLCGYPTAMADLSARMSLGAATDEDLCSGIGSAHLDGYRPVCVSSDGACGNGGAR